MQIWYAFGNKVVIDIFKLLAFQTIVSLLDIVNVLQLYCVSYPNTVFLIHWSRPAHPYQDIVDLNRMFFVLTLCGLAVVRHK